MLIQVMLLSDSSQLRRRLEALIDPAAGMVSAATEIPPKSVADPCCDLVFVERSQLGRVAGRSVDRLRSLPERPEVVVLSDVEDPNERARLLVAGCKGVIYTGLPDELLRETLATFIRRRRENLERRLKVRQRNGQYRLDELLSSSPAMQELYEPASRLAAADSSLVVLGETGVGKEWLARAIHAAGTRADAPFVPVHCAAIPESLLESELFGQERGAFTGATAARRGQFEVAHRGTLLLDEIGDMPLSLQTKLLRVLQDKRIQRVGGEKSFPVDVRIIAATHRDLPAEVEAGRFRGDLYYRLAVVSLRVPPLRERLDDIPRLTQLFLEHFRSHLGRNVWGIEDEAMDLLLSYPWPGNVRELVNVLERSVLLGRHEEIRVSDLPLAVRGGQAPASAADERLEDDVLRVTVPGWRELPFKELKQAVIEATERRYLAEQLRIAEGRIGEAAERAGLDPKTLYEKMRRYGLDKQDFKNRLLRWRS